MKTEDMKDRALTDKLQLVQNPELIKVQTISKRIVEQLPFFGPDHKSKFNLDGFVFVGKLPEYATVVCQDKGTKEFGRVRSISIIEALMEAGVSNSDAIETIRRIPQLFTT